VNSSTFNFKKWLFVFAAAASLTAFVFLLSAELLIRTKVQKKDAFEHHRALFFNSDSRNAVFGDSHASQGFTGQKDFINLAAPSENLDIILGKISLYFSQRPAGKIILQIDPHLFSDYRENMNAGSFLKDYQSPAEPFLYSLTARHRINLINYFKVFLKRGAFQSKFVLQKDGAQTLDEPMTQSRTPQEIREQTRRRIKLQAPAPGFENGKTAGTLKKILSLLKTKNADVCIVSFPMSPQYLMFSQNYSGFKDAQNFIEQLAGQFGYSYFNGWNKIQNPDLFSSEDHLNTAGAALFAEMAVKECFHTS